MSLHRPSVNHHHRTRAIRIKELKGTYSSVRGVIFFSGSSSSAKFFLYFSQFSPVALGMMTVLTA